MLNRIKNMRFLKRYFILLPVALLSLSASAQLGERNESNLIDLGSKPKIHRNGDDFYNAIKFGVVMPQGLFAQPITNPGGDNFSKLTLPFKGKDGLGAKQGFNFQYDGFSSIGRAHERASVTTHFGFQYGLEFGYIPLSWNNVNWGIYNMNVGTSPFIYTGLKFGPGFYFNPTKDMGIGLYATCDLNFMVPGGAYATYNYTDPAGNNTVTAYYIQDTTVIHTSVNASAGINIYYKTFIIGIEYNWMHTRFDASVTQNNAETSNIGKITTPTSYYSFSNVIHTDVIKITLGIRLGWGCKHRYDDEQ